MKLKVGDLVRFHDSLSRKRKSGIIVEAFSGFTDDRPQGQSYTILWNSGKLSKHSRWELFKLEDK